MVSKKEIGRYGENIVASHLKGQGFTILAQNYCIRGGELDLIAQKNELLVFVEVKTRKVAYFALSEVITKTKQRFLVRAAEHFLLKKSLRNIIIRFDVALVQGDALISYISNAFTKATE